MVSDPNAQFCLNVKILKLEQLDSLRKELSFRSDTAIYLKSGFLHYNLVGHSSL